MLLLPSQHAFLSQTKQTHLTHHDLPHQHHPNYPRRPPHNLQNRAYNSFRLQNRPRNLDPLPRPLATPPYTSLIPGAPVAVASHDAPPPYVEAADLNEELAEQSEEEDAGEDSDDADADGSEADASDSNDETEPDSVNSEDVVDLLIRTLLCLPSKISPTPTFREKVAVYLADGYRRAREREGRAQAGVDA